MNETRVRKLASEGNVELTRKMLRRACKESVDVKGLIEMLAKSELKDENVLSYPDFNFQMGSQEKERERDLICAQATDGRSVRIVGFINRKKKSRK